MGVLIDDLMTLSKLGRPTLSTAEIDRQALIENVVAEVCDRDRYDHATVVFENLPTGLGNLALPRQVSITLISNALKCSSKNSDASVRISGLCNEVECTCSVSDNGAGFDMAYSDKLFGAFSAAE